MSKKLTKFRKMVSPETLKRKLTKGEGGGKKQKKGAERVKSATCTQGGGGGRGGGNGGDLEKVMSALDKVTAKLSDMEENYGLVQERLATVERGKTTNDDGYTSSSDEVEFLHTQKVQKAVPYKNRGFGASPQALLFTGGGLGGSKGRKGPVKGHGGLDKKVVAQAAVIKELTFKLAKEKEAHDRSMFYLTVGTAMSYVKEERYPLCPLLETLFFHQKGFTRDSEGNFSSHIDLTGDWLSVVKPNKGQRKLTPASVVANKGNGGNWATNYPLVLTLALSLELALREADGVYYDSDDHSQHETLTDAWIAVLGEFSLTRRAFGEEKEGKFEHFSTETVKKKLNHLRGQEYSLQMPEGQTVDISFPKIIKTWETCRDKQREDDQKEVLKENAEKVKGDDYDLSSASEEEKEGGDEKKRGIVKNKVGRTW